MGDELETWIKANPERAHKLLPELGLKKCFYPNPVDKAFADTAPPPASQSTDPRAQFDSSGKLIAYDARGGGMYGPFPASQSSTNSPEIDSKLVGEDASQSAPSAGSGEFPPWSDFWAARGDTKKSHNFDLFSEVEAWGQACYDAGLATAGQVPDTWKRIWGTGFDVVFQHGYVERDTPPALAEKIEALRQALGAIDDPGHPATAGQGVES